MRWDEARPLKMAPAYVADWLRRHPRAWDGYPTNKAIFCDELERMNRTARLLAHGLPLSADLSDVEDQIAHLRLERRAQYARAVHHAAD